MTSGPHYEAAVLRKGGSRRAPQKTPKPRFEKTCHFSGSKNKFQRLVKSSCGSDGQKTGFRDPVEMEPTPDSLPDWNPKEMCLRWFIETQASLLARNGVFPSWFFGFISRAAAEEILREKGLGCFLIRLSDKAVGFILSYKGKERCRHFVIIQNEWGQLVVSGDTKGHLGICQLIEHYKTSPIEPFGEYLTSCSEVQNDEVYDVIWVGLATAPALDAPRRRRSVDAPKEVPLARSGGHGETVLLDERGRVLYAQLRKQPSRPALRPLHTSPSESLHHDGSQETRPEERRAWRRPLSGSVYSEPGPLDAKSRSLPLLDQPSDGDQIYRAGVFPNTPPRRRPKPAWRDAISGAASDRCGGRPASVPGLERLSHRAVAHPTRTHVTSETRSRAAPAEVRSEASLGRQHGGRLRQTQDAAKRAEPLEPIRPKSSHAFWGLKDYKWKWPFQQIKKKP